MNKPSISRKDAVLEVIRTSKPLPPTYQDIMALTGIPSTSVVNYYLDRLEDEGKIIRLRNKNGIALTRGLLPVTDEQEEQNGR